MVSILELAKAYGLFTGEIPTFEHIGVDFDDGVFQSKDALLNFYGKAKTFGLIPTVEIIERVFKVPEETAKEWVKQIENEQAIMDPINISQRRQEELFGSEE